MMTKLSVNVNKIALLRNARGGDIPNLIQCAKDCERFGAQGITVHPRPDERHVRYTDVHDLKKVVRTELNVEGYPSPQFINMIMEVCPDQCTLVPDAPDALTSNTGWDMISEENFLRPIVKKMHAKNIRVSIFVDPQEEAIKKVKEIGAQRIELYTGPYAHQYKKNKNQAIQSYHQAAQIAYKIGLGINAGHDLNLENLSFFAENIPHLLEVSIGHALIKDALYFGMENTIQMYKRCLSI